MEEIIWYKDIRKFLTDFERYTYFLPDKTYTLVENLNACLRFSIYFSIVMAVIKKDIRTLLFPIVVSIITFVIFTYEVKESQNKKELFKYLNLEEDKHRKNKVCYKPSKDNPFMNISFMDRKSFQNRPPACNILKKSVKQEVATLFNDGLFRDVDDIFSKKASDRQFYTTPITTIPNDQSKFAEWCFRP